MRILVIIIWQGRFQSFGGMLGSQLTWNLATTCVSDIELDLSTSARARPYSAPFAKKSRALHAPLKLRFSRTSNLWIYANVLAPFTCIRNVRRLDHSTSHGLTVYLLETTALLACIKSYCCCWEMLLLISLPVFLTHIHALGVPNFVAIFYSRYCGKYTYSKWLTPAVLLICFKPLWKLCVLYS